ncbi:hypothetical protein KFK09_008633 [Dendrobium nobile]|uniref:Protein kinase G11A n=1 Tax=Dendrobium nobile TaxID=94219 RepID=A0A8T3BPG3_DENNO|nr:hypothetical protein KFK09_008633 [Dendrobium nobile]
MSPVHISGPCLHNIMSSARATATSEGKSGIELGEKATFDPTNGASTCLSKNPSQDVCYLSDCLPSSQTLYPSRCPSSKPLTSLETKYGKALSNKVKLDPLIVDSATSENFSSSLGGSDPFPNLHPKAPLKIENTPKVSNNKKKMFTASEDGTNLAKNPSSTLDLYRNPCLSPSLETASTSTINLTSFMKQSDANTIDDGTTTTRSSCGSPQSDNLNSFSSGTAPVKRHTGYDSGWEAIQLASSRDPPLGLGHFKLIKRLGFGDIGSVYLVELKDTGAYFAMKVMDRASLISRNKLVRAHTEREILGLLDHPFLPTLYSHFETDKFYCLVMEYCSGGNLHSLRQKQPNKYFSEKAARFYASEILLALEYLHVLGIVYRDLKPENVLVREEGHIMLSDFDLSLRCTVSPTLVKSSSVPGRSSDDLRGILDGNRAVQGCLQPTAFFPRILPKRNRKSKSDFGLAAGALPELMAEPTNARSMSFVGTNEYLAPEIIRGEGHGSAVDWWTFGIFIYELIYGTTPFKGSGNGATLYNVVGQPLRFPDEPVVSSSTRDLIRGLLVKDPQRRIAYRRGATEIKQHPFFAGVSWALVRSMQPPHIPQPAVFGQFSNKQVNAKKKSTNESGGKDKQNRTGDMDFEYF